MYCVNLRKFLCFWDSITVLLFVYADNLEQVAKTLKQLQMKVIDYKRYCAIDRTANERRICAVSLNRADDICQGDSGGPLACRETDGKWYLRGVTSATTDEKCFESGAFTKVTDFMDWINEKIASK